MIKERKNRSLVSGNFENNFTKWSGSSVFKDLCANEGHRTANRSSEDVIHPENHESLMDKKRNRGRGYGNGSIQEIPSQHHQKKQLKFFGHIIKADGIEKRLWSGKICGLRPRCRQFNNLPLGSDGKTNANTLTLSVMRKMMTQSQSLKVRIQRSKELGSKL